jgi:hypothetical protein
VQLFLSPQKITTTTAERLGLPYISYGTANKNKIMKILKTPFDIWDLRKKIKAFDPQVCIGPLPMIYASASLGIPCYIFEDDEVCWMQQFFYKPFVRKIITPVAFRTDFGKKHVRMKGYKELAYLKDFKPNNDVLDYVSKEKYILIRWNDWSAIHDIGKKGFNASFVLQAIQYFEDKKFKVYISTERNLPPELERYKLKLPFDLIHSALYHADLVISDTQTMTTEAAMLGVPVIRSNSFVGKHDMSNFQELESYGLIFNFRHPESAFVMAKKLADEPNLIEQWKPKLEKLLKDKEDIVEFMVKEIEDGRGN